MATSARRAGAVVGAVIAAVLAWVVAVPVGGVDLEVDMDGRTEGVGLRDVVVVALGSGLLGWALLATLEWRVRRAPALWTASAIAVTLLSLLGPLAWAATTGALAVLVCLHLVVAAVLIPAMRRTASGVLQKINFPERA